jgi:hypothetical protein
VAFSLEQIATIVVDYISFNITGFTNTESIAKYLSGFGFNSFQLNKQEGLPRMEILFKHPKNRFNVIFSRPIEYWNGIVISFSGQNATYFYQFSLDGWSNIILDINYLKFNI